MENLEYIKPSELTPLPAENIDAADIAPVIFEGQTYRLPPALLKGKDGVTPYIQNGTWWVDGTDTGIKADYATEEAARASAETTRQSNEATRVNNETSRQTAETSRSTAESTRQNNESDRQTSEGARATAETARSNAEAARDDAETLRDLAESDRATAETSRENAESSRSAAETSRASAETTRASAETTRQNNESDRQTAEGSRSSAETNRANAESSRVSSENTRQANETNRENSESSRATAEISRVNAETTRASAETTRQNNESDRQTAISELVAKGDYSASTQYKKNNTVLYLGSGYMAIQDPPVGTAPTNGTYWKKIAEKGLDGEGAGDMLKSTYDTNDNGKIDTAEQADNATNADKLANVAANLYALKTYVDAAIDALAIGDVSGLQTALDGKLAKAGGAMNVGAIINFLTSNNDVDFLRVGESNGYGFYFRYTGTQSGNDNALELWSENSTGTHQRIFRAFQDGVISFDINIGIGGGYVWNSSNFDPSSKENAFSKNSAFNKNFGSAAGTICQGNDSRLSNARDWTASEVSQSEAEAGLGTTPRKWSAERVAQAISALGGGVTVKDLIGYQKSESAALSGYGVFSTISQQAGSSGSGTDEYGIFRYHMPASYGTAYWSTSATYRLWVESLPSFAIKFRKLGSNYARLGAGLSTDQDSYNTIMLGLVADNHTTREAVFIVKDGSNYERIDTGVIIDDKLLILIVDVISTSEVIMSLYDEDYTLLYSHTFTQYIPTGEAFYLKSAYLDQAGITNNQIRYYSRSVIFKR